MDYELRTMGGVYLDESSVSAYKAEQLDRLKNPEKYFVPDPAPSRFKAFALRLIACVAFIGVLYLPVVFPALRSHGLICLVILVFAAIGCSIVWGYTECDFYPSPQTAPAPRPQAEWEVYSLGKYKEEFPWKRIPKPELEKVAELRSRLPGVEFMVHSLYEDPFIEAIYKNPKTGVVHRRFIGYWDEDTFVNSPPVPDSYAHAYLPVTPSNQN